MSRKSIWLCALLVLLSGCSDSSPVGPERSKLNDAFAAEVVCDPAKGCLEPIEFFRWTSLTAVQVAGTLTAHVFGEFTLGGELFRIDLFCGDGSIIPTAMTVGLAADGRSGTASGTCTYAKPGLYKVQVTAYHASNKTSFGTIVEILDRPSMPPEITRLVLPGAPVPLGSEVSVTVEYADDPGDAHTVVVHWPDGTTTHQVAPKLDASGSGSLTVGWTPLAAGVYTIDAEIFDASSLGDARSSTEDVPGYIVVYDPAAGFVTGGGWIDSPAGACRWSGCAADGTTTGKATFGFVSRYRQGATLPSGNTEFQFRAGGLNFSSSAYDWLVIAGARAQYKGIGMIDGQGDYGFMITAIDGDLLGGNSDAFRVRIWDRAAGDAVVYDNQMGMDEISDATTALGGGSIVIHKN